MSTNLLFYFPPENLLIIRSSSLVSVSLVILSQVFYIVSASLVQQSIYIDLTSLCCLLLAALIFAFSCAYLLLPLLVLINESDFHSIEHKTEFYRITTLVLFFVIISVLHFTISKEALFASYILQILLFTFLNGQRTHQYRLSWEENEQKLLERLDMMRYISHEMRTPLNSAAIGLSMGLSISVELETSLRSSLDELIAEKKAKSERFELVKRYVDLASDLVNTVTEIQDSCTVAVATLDDILTFDKFSEGKLTVEFKDLHPWQFLSHTAQPFRFNATEKDIDLKINCDEERSTELANCVVKGDPFKLGQVIRNLISNALKFTPENSTVEVKLELLPVSVLQPIIDEEEGEEEASKIPDFQHVARISVIDSGVGISEADQRKLFRQYVQIKPGQLQEGKGSGLGLWISKRIVDLHSGYIGVTSQGEGMGSTFFVDLPAYSVVNAKRRLSILLQTNLLADHNDSTKASTRVAPAETLPNQKEADLISHRKAASSRTFKAIKQPKKLSAIFPSSISTSFILSPSGSDSPSGQNDFKHIGNSLNWKILTPINTKSSSLGTISESTAAVLKPPINTLRSELLRPWDLGLNFLIVDDALSNRKLTKKALERHGHFVLVAKDGVESVEIIEERINTNEVNENILSEHHTSLDSEVKGIESRAIDIILMDDSMPRMTGVEATRIIREKGFRGLIYGVTGDVDRARQQEFLDAGASWIFSKPLDILELKKCIKEKHHH